MGAKATKNLNDNFFQTWSPDMAYVLGYFVADGCLTVDKRRSNSLSLNITSKDKTHLYQIRRVLDSTHKIGSKSNGRGDISFQIQIRNSALAEDLQNLGIHPRKTYNLKPLDIPSDHFSDFVRGFFDGDGSVYIYKVNNVPQIKASFVCTSFAFLTDLNTRLCKFLNITDKSIHRKNNRINRIPLYDIVFYIDDCIQLYQFMYGGQSRLFLPRKKRIFERWLSMKRRVFTKRNYPSKVGWHLNSKIKIYSIMRV